MLAAMKSAGVAPEVNLKEHLTHKPLQNTNKAAHSDFKIPRGDVQNRGISGQTKRTYVFQNFFLRKSLNMFSGVEEATMAR